MLFEAFEAFDGVKGGDPRAIECFKYMFRPLPMAIVSLIFARAYVTCDIKRQGKFWNQSEGVYISEPITMFDSHQPIGS